MLALTGTCVQVAAALAGNQGLFATSDFPDGLVSSCAAHACSSNGSHVLDCAAGASPVAVTGGVRASWIHT